MWKILVTGGAGFIGSHIADSLLEKGYSVAVVDNLSTGPKKNLNRKAKFYKADIQDKKISKIFSKEKPDAVFHYAAQISVRGSVSDPIGDAKINILGSLNILENCKKYKIKKFIFASSGGTIYGDADDFPIKESSKEAPLSPYAIAKLSVEKYLYYYQKFFGLDFVSLRLSNVYGPRQNSKGEAGVIAIFTGKMLGNGQPLINGDGLQKRDFIFVKDAVDASILALLGKDTGIFNVGTGKETDIKTVFLKLKELTNSNAKETHGTQSLGETRRNSLDYSKINKSFNWHPKYDLDSGLIETVNWFSNKK